MTELAFTIPPELVETIAQRAAEIMLERQGVMAASTSPYMTVPEAAEYARCKRQRIDDLLSSGRLTRFKEGGRTLVSRAELEQHIAGAVTHGRHPLRRIA